MQLGAAPADLLYRHRRITLAQVKLQESRSRTSRSPQRPLFASTEARKTVSATDKRLATAESLRRDPQQRKSESPPPLAESTRQHARETVTNRSLADRQDGAADNNGWSVRVAAMSKKPSEMSGCRGLAARNSAETSSSPATAIYNLCVSVLVD